MYQDLSIVKSSGFSGFKSVKQLWDDQSVIPKEKGVYIILNPDHSLNTFLATGSGGHFKSKNPNVQLMDLTEKWVSSCHVLYIGQAGGKGSSATLYSRLKQYLYFGRGKPVGHYGGRYIWQLLHHEDLLIAWKILKKVDPAEEELTMLTAFNDYYGKLPFANLRF